MKLVKLLSAVALCAAPLACGSPMGAPSEAAGKDLVAQDGAAALAQYRLVVGDFDANNSAPECLALRTKIFANRKEVQGGSEWRTIVETASCKRIDKLEEQFRNSHCNASAPRVNKLCSDLTDDLEAEANNLANTPQWQTLANNKNWNDLLVDFNKARQIHCF